MEDSKIDVISGDGSAVTVQSEELSELQQEVSAIADSLKDSNKSVAYDTRYCYWPNQSADGRKREEAFKASNEDPLPFNGATDARVRDADMIINEQVELVLLAAVLSVIRVKPVGGEDAQQAGNLKLMVDHYIQQMGFSYMRELMRLANFQFGGAPGVGILGVEWVQESALELKTITLPDLQQMATELQLQAAGLDENSSPEVLVQAIRESTIAFVEALMDPAGKVEELEAVMKEFFPAVRDATAKRVIKEIRAEVKRGKELGAIEVDFPIEYLRRNEPEFTALEPGRDIFLPVDTENFDTGWGYFVSELLTKAQVKERAQQEEWNEQAVKELLGDPTSEIPSAVGKVTLRQWRWKNGVLVAESDETYKNRFEVITAVVRSTNDEGIAGIYQTRFSMNASEALTKKELRADAHGKFPAVAFSREYVSRQLLSARGVSELEQAGQGLTKLFTDTAGDNAQFNGVPPVISQRRMGAGRAYLEPMEEITLSPGGSFKFMNPPPFPTAAMKMFDELGKRRDDYWGRLNPGLSPKRSQRRERFIVMHWLGQLRDALVMLAQLIQQYAPDEVVNRVLDGTGTLNRSREEIQGCFDYTIEFDVDVLDPETLETKLNILKNVLLAMDSDQTIIKSEVVSYFMYMINPGLARTALRPVDDAQLNELMDEAKQYERIRAGLPTDMPTDGSINAQLRMTFYENMQQANPAVFGDMAEDKITGLQERMQYLQHQAQQYGENAQTGRTGVDATVGGIKSGVARQ